MDFKENLTYRWLLLGLLLLVATSFIFTTPGIAVLAKFDNLSSTLEKAADFNRIFIYHPPGLTTIYSWLLFFFKLDPAIPLFDHQQVWFFFKVLLAFFYLLTWGSIVFFARGLKGMKWSSLDISIVYFGSVSIILTSLALSTPEIIAAPFFVLMLTFLYKKKYGLVSLFYIALLCFNWSFLIFAPVLYLFSLKEENLSAASRFFNKLSFVIIPSTVIAIYFSAYRSTPFIIFGNKSNNLINIPWLMDQGFSLLLQGSEKNSVFYLVILISFLTSIVFVGALLRLSFSKTLGNLRIPKAVPFIIATGLLFLPALFLNFVFVSYIALFLFLIYFLLRFYKGTTFNSHLNLMLVIYLLFLSLAPGFSEGNLLFLVVLGVTGYLVNRNELTYFSLLLLNLTVFLDLFFVYGNASILRLKGDYFTLMQLVLSGSLIYVVFLYFKMAVLTDFFKYLKVSLDKALIKQMSYMIVIILIIANFCLITANGSPDTVSWAQYAVASVENHNPFFAQTIVDQRYPPVNTLIIWIFADTWRQLIGVDQTYAISTKISVFVFYFLTVFALLKFNLNSDKKLPKTAMLLVILTAFSLIIQTQGFADVNIYLIPTLLLSFTFFFKRKYLLSSIFMGITLSIKWQPIILLPLFYLSLFNFKDNFGFVIRKSAIFTLGFLPIPLLTWVLVLIYPGGREALDRALDYLINGAPMLSGQALNLNWIATYVIHIFEPVRFGSVQQLDYLNRQIPTDYSPWFLRGYLFLIVSAAIFIKYWVGQKKSLTNFLTAAVLIFFTHHQLNKSAYEKHIFYVTLLMLALYLVRPTEGNKKMLVLFDIMTVMNLIFFYGFTGPKDVNRLFLNLDLTVVFSFYYLIIYSWVMIVYFRKGRLPLS